MAIWDGIVGGLLNFFGGERRNKEAEDAAQKQMEFQAMMSNSAYQRGVEDLKKAGLNPMLAFKNPASSPLGAMQQVENSLGNAVNTAYSSAVQTETMRNLQEQNKLLGAQKVKAEAEARNTDVDTMRKYVEIPQIEQNTATAAQSEVESRQRERLLLRQTETEVVRGKLTYEEARLVEERVRNAVREGRLIDARTDETNARAVLEKLAEFQARNRAAHEVEYAGYAQHIRPFLEDAQRFFGSGAAAGRMFDSFRRGR